MRKERSILAEGLRDDFLEVVAYEQDLGRQQKFRQTVGSERQKQRFNVRTAQVTYWKCTVGSSGKSTGKLGYDQIKMDPENAREHGLVLAVTGKAPKLSPGWL